MKNIIAGEGSGIVEIVKALLGVGAAGIVIFIVAAGLEGLFVYLYFAMALVLPVPLALWDLLRGRLEARSDNFLLQVLLNYLVYFRLIFFFIVIVPVLVIDILSGPLLYMLLGISSILLAMSLTEVLTGIDVVSNDLTSSSALAVLAGILLVSGTGIYVVSRSSMEPGESLLGHIMDFYDSLIERTQKALGQ